ncbi:hypothetical protein SBRCBS47491_003504 [Sporothrix bragantina]|uniref:Alpha-L-rhamnosidase six-hairpin glycosidase domain-containing protein n=1 Tax=Sporothrix bragantina TaxID=671064 RepID=A0ABP0BFT9_9PEZI
MSLKLSSRHFNATFSQKNGSVQSIRNTVPPFDNNFVLNQSIVPSFDVQDSRWLGDLIFHVKRHGQDHGSTLTSGLSADIRTIEASPQAITVQYQGPSRNRGGFTDFSVTETYSLDGTSGEILHFTITVKNTSDSNLEFEDFGLPLLMNSYWGNNQTHNYEEAVHRHSFVANHGSYIYWQRPNGRGPMLVMIPDRGTSLEFKQRFREDDDSIFGEKLPKWEGLVEFYIHSKHVANARSRKARQYLPATSLVLSSGQSKTYGFGFRWADGYAGLREALVSSGSLSAISLPGMVIPMDTTVTLALCCLDPITSVYVGSGVGKDKVTEVGTRNGHRIFHLNFSKLGPHDVHVTFGDARESVLQYYSIEPLDTLLVRHCRFLSQNQLAKTDRGYDGAFLQWDMTNRKLVTWDDYPGGGWKAWMAGGSDDLGLAPAVFLSEKCLSLPEQSEVTAIDYHIDHFLLGYLIGARNDDGQRTFQVYRWFDGQDGAPEDTGIWRAYNYTHIANTLFNMYRIAKAYPHIETTHPALDYLRYAYEVLNAMYSKIPLPNPIGDAANTLGLMGESTVPEIMEALHKEQMAHEAEFLGGYIDRKLQHYHQVPYPFASEMTIDTTGFESVYALAKLRGFRELVEKSQLASLASRGLQPLWYFYGSDNRMMGESYWNLGYETQLGAWQQQDYLMHFSNEDQPNFADSMRSTYGAYLAGWANINSGQIDSHPANIGAASWQWQSEGGQPSWPWLPLVEGTSWWAWSGEAELGFWGALRMATVNVVQDPVVGLFAYGGEVELVEENP